MMTKMKLSQMTIRATFVALAILLLACTPKEAEDKNAEGTKSSEGESASGEGAGNEQPETEAPATGEAPNTEEAPATGQAPATGEVPAGDAGTATANAGETVPAGETRHYGGEFTIAEAAMPLDAAVAKVDELVGTTVKVEGTVKTACRKKGCWMQLEPTAEGAEPLRVSFKDYGFFVPKQADGAHAVMEGEFIKDTMTEAQRKHLAEDGNKPQEEIDAIKGDVAVVRFVANAVDLTGAEAKAE